jgi:hypothetical protein
LADLENKDQQVEFEDEISQEQQEGAGAAEPHQDANQVVKYVDEPQGEFSVISIKFFVFECITFKCSI